MYCVLDCTRRLGVQSCVRVYGLLVRTAHYTLFTTRTHDDQRRVYTQKIVLWGRFGCRPLNGCLYVLLDRDTGLNVLFEYFRLLICASRLVRSELCDIFLPPR
jgi:hypothetical protein